MVLTATVNVEDFRVIVGMDIVRGTVNVFIVDSSAMWCRVCVLVWSWVVIEVTAWPYSGRTLGHSLGISRGHEF